MKKRYKILIMVVLTVLLGLTQLHVGKWTLVTSGKEQEISRNKVYVLPYEIKEADVLVYSAYKYRSYPRFTNRPLIVKVTTFDDSGKITGENSVEANVKRLSLFCVETEELLFAFDPKMKENIRIKGRLIVFVPEPSTSETGKLNIRIEIN